MPSKHKSATVLCLCLLIPASFLSAQDTVKQVTKDQADFSAEPLVYEQVHGVLRFENDGTGSTEIISRVRLQSEAGVRSMGQLIFDYNAGNQRAEIRYVRVIKPNGETIIAGAEAVQDLSAPVSQAAPVYSDMHQKHVTVPGLSVGDILEADVVTTTFQPFTPGQFWQTWNFMSDNICLHEQLELDVPRERLLKIKNPPNLEPLVKELGERRIYRWETSNLQAAKPFNPLENLKGFDPVRILSLAVKPTPRRVMFSSFQSWEQVGQWYSQLEHDRKIATPSVRAKADEIVKGSTSDLIKAQAIYAYVSRNIRYVSLSFGVGRYQPHAATDVITNQYGDCKDKATLLDALFDAEGLKSSTALVNSGIEVDPDVPSPQQFDHAISYVTVSGKDYWLDSTVGVAPFGYVIPQLRGKNALVVISAQQAPLQKTPENLGIPTIYAMDIQSNDTSGKLDTQISFDIRGEWEVLLRSLILAYPVDQLNSMLGQQAKQAVAGSDFSVTNLKTSDPFDIQKPFHVEAHVLASIPSSNGAIPLLSDLSNEFAALNALLPDVPSTQDGVAQPLKLGGPKEMTLHLKMQIPAAAELPKLKSVHLAKDFAEFDATASLNGRELTAEWRLNLHAETIPKDRVQEYASFHRDVLNGEIPFTLDANRGSTVAGASTGSATPDQLYRSGLQAFDGGDYKKAQQDFERFVALYPYADNVWNDLGRAYASQGTLDEAIKAYQKAIELNPGNAFAYNNLGMVYLRQRSYDQAVKLFQKQIEIVPEDRYAHSNLGRTYFTLEQYNLAEPELEKGAALNPVDANVRIFLGRTYLKLNKADDAIAVFDRAVQVAPNPVTWNAVAYYMADYNLQLERANNFAESAVTATDALLRNISLAHLSMTDVSQVFAVAAYWDTLGWVKFRTGDIAGAENYIRASWELSGDSTEGLHLGQIYEKEGKKADAIHVFALSLGLIDPDKELRPRLVALVGGDAKADELIDSMRPHASDERTIRFKNTRNVHGKAEFWLLLDPGSKVEDVRLASGDDGLKVFVTDLRAATYPKMIPDATDTKILRRGVLDCSPYGTACVFVLVPPDTVHSVD